MIKYSIYENPVTTSKSPEKRGYHIRQVDTKSVDLDIIMQGIENQGRWRTYLVRHIIGHVIEHIKGYLADGYRIQIKDFGTLSINISGPSISDPEAELRPGSIEIKKVEFKQNAKLVKDLNARATYAKSYTQLHNPPLTDEQIDDLLTEYFRNNHLIDITRYADLARCTAYAAKKTLKELEEKGVLVREGNDRYACYSLAEKAKYGWVKYF